MAYEVLEVVALPVQEEREVHPGIKAMVATGESLRKEPGDTITKQEMKDHGQSDDDVKSLIRAKAIKEQE